MKTFSMLRFIRGLIGVSSLRVLLGVCLLTAACIWWGIPQRLHAANFEIRGSMIFLALCSSLGVMSMRAWRWNLLLGSFGRRLAVGPLLKIYGATFFLGAVSPGPVAEIMRAWLTRDRVATPTLSAMSLIYDRIFDIIPVLMVTALFGTMIGLSHFSAYAIYWQIGAGLLALLLMSALVYPRPWLHLLQSSVARLARQLEGDRERVDESASQTGWRIAPATLVRCFLLSAASQFFLVLQTWCIAQAISSDIQPWTAYAVTAAATLVAALPTGIGSREAAVYFILLQLGINAEFALGFSVVSFFNFLSVMMVTFLAFAAQPLQAQQAFDLLRRRRQSRRNAVDTNP